jgi:hypothetical protein
MGTQTSLRQQGQAPEARSKEEEKVLTRISPKRRTAIEEYIKYAQHALRLDDWIIYLSDDEPTGDDDDKPTAQIATRATNRYAILRIGDRFFNSDDVTDAMRTVVLCHELVHCHLDALSTVTWNLIDSHLHPSTRNDFQTVANNIEERAVDQIAWAFAELLSQQFILPDAD